MKTLHTLRVVSCLLSAFAILPISAANIPAQLPPPDAAPPSKDKPVKVYILSSPTWWALAP